MITVRSELDAVRCDLPNFRLGHEVPEETNLRPANHNWQRSFGPCQTCHSRCFQRSISMVLFMISVTVSTHNVLRRYP